MSLFVHLTPEKYVADIERSGIKQGRSWSGGPKGVFAMPVVRNFYISHQWLRELKRGGQRTIVAVYFRIPDDEFVWIGHYGVQHWEMTAAEAEGVMMSADNREGYEVVIPRKITSKEIHRTRTLRQVVGWRYQPGAHKLSTCMCVVCNPKGAINSRKKWRRWEDRQAESD